MTFAPDFFRNGGEIAKNLQFWRINEDDSPKFMVDRLKIWYFAPIYGSLGNFFLVRPLFAGPGCSCIGYGATQDLGLLSLEMYARTEIRVVGCS